MKPGISKKEFNIEAYKLLKASHESKANIKEQRTLMTLKEHSKNLKKLIDHLEKHLDDIDELFGKSNRDDFKNKIIPEYKQEQEKLDLEIHNLVMMLLIKHEKNIS